MLHFDFETLVMRFDV